MKVRALSQSGDYQLNVFLSNSSECVAQCVSTRLKLWLGQWFADLSDGTDWSNAILGFNTPYDLTIQDRILGTEGVTEIVSYQSNITDRNLSVTAYILTSYDTTPVVVTFNTGF